MVRKLWRWATATSVREFITLLCIVIAIRTFGFGLYEVPTPSMESTMLTGERFFADKFTPLFFGQKRGDIISFNEPLYNYSSNPSIKIFQEYFWGPQNWTKRVIGVPGDKIRGAIEDGKPVVYINGQKLDEPYINKYTLVHMFKDDPVHSKELVVREALEYIRREQIDPNYFKEIRDQVLASPKYCFTLSYDPNVPLSKQPFYSMPDERMLKNEQGILIRTEPGKPLPTGRSVEHKEGDSYWNGSDEYYVELNDHQYWVMGDNRLGSWDSRFWGPLDARQIRGRVLFRIISIDKDPRDWLITDLLKHPIDFWRRVRWSRFFQVLH